LIWLGSFVLPQVQPTLIWTYFLGLYLPPHSIDLFVGLSRQVSLQTPHLSLDVAGAFLEHFQSYNPQQKEYGLLYIQPWIPQIETQLRTGSADFVETTKEIKSVLRAFIRLTHEQPQVPSCRYVLTTISWPGIHISGHQSEKFLSCLSCCWLNYSIMQLTLVLGHTKLTLRQGFY
jgi:hypothetical protein